MSDASTKIRVKLLGKYKPGHDGLGWHRRFPGGEKGETAFGNCVYTFDRDERDYDWLVVWDDLPSLNGERHTLWEEQLACPRANTLLVTTEPSTIKVYGSRFLKQFGHVLTSQESWAVGNHPGMIQEQTSYVWFYSKNDPRGAYDTIRKHVPLEKSGVISAVCSTKQQRHTLHQTRYHFVMGLKERMPDIELYGRGVRFVEDKADAIDPYQYHIAIENFYGPHHWTEKLADPFLGACMPIYYGCPNAEDYFPAESFLRIDLHDLDHSAEMIEKAIRDKLYEKHRDAVLESRRRVIEEYSPAANITRLVNQLNDPDASTPDEGDVVSSRHAFRKKSVVNGASFLAEKLSISLKHKLLSTNDR